MFSVLLYLSIAIGRAKRVALTIELQIIKKIIISSLEQANNSKNNTTSSCREGKKLHSSISTSLRTSTFALIIFIIVLSYDSFYIVSINALVRYKMKTSSRMVSSLRYSLLLLYGWWYFHRLVPQRMMKQQQIMKQVVLRRQHQLMNIMMQLNGKWVGRC